MNLSDEALRLRVMNLHNFVFTRKQREEKKKHDEMRAKGTCFAFLFFIFFRSHFFPMNGSVAIFWS